MEELNFFPIIERRQLSTVNHLLCPGNYIYLRATVTIIISKNQPVKDMNTHLGQTSNATTPSRDKEDWCSKCNQYGKRHQMFTCQECKEAWHPPCITEYLPKDENDTRYRMFFCIPCAKYLSKRRWAPKRKYKTFQSDSE